MHWYEAEVCALECSLAQSPRSVRPLVFYGSSSIRQWRTLAADLACPGIINAGFGGSTLEACNYYFERLISPLSPDSLILYAGDNDLGDGQSPLQVMASFHVLLHKIDTQLSSTRFGFLAIKPSPARWHLQYAIRQTNKMVRNSLDERANGIYIDTFQPMLDRHGQPRAELYQADGLHLSQAGYLLWARILTNYQPSLL